MATGKSLPLNKIILAFILSIFFFITAKTAPTINSVLPDTEIKPITRFDTDNLADGDLIFRKGHDLVSRLILSQGKTAQFSHVGVIIKDETTVSVVHSLPEDATSSEGVQIEPLNSFISSENASDIAIYRIKDIDASSTLKVKDYVIQQVDKPFDRNFLMSTDDSMYCTELVVKALTTAGLDIQPKLLFIKVMLIDEPVISPDNLRRSHYLKRI